MFDRCTSCEKLLNNNGNLVKYGVIVASSGVGITLAGWTLLGSIPALFGFTTSGIGSNSIAASWQSSIGSVPAGSMFSVLQSLGATGIALFPFSLVGPAASTGVFYAIHKNASKLCWCECEKPLVDK